MPREGRLSRAPPEPPRPRHRATPAPHGNTRYGRRKNGPQRQTRRARGVERSPPGDGLLGPRERSGREGFPTFSEVFPSRDVFRVSLFRVSIVWKTFLRGWNPIIPPGIFFRVPRCFGSAVERPTLCIQISGSSLACRLFFLLLSFVLVWVLQ